MYVLIHQLRLLVVTTFTHILMSVPLFISQKAKQIFTMGLADWIIDYVWPNNMVYTYLSMKQNHRPDWFTRPTRSDILHPGCRKTLLAMWIIDDSCLYYRSLNNLYRFSFDPLGRPTIPAGSDHCFATCCPYVRPSPLYKSSKTKRQKTMFATGETVGLAEWIIDDTCVVLPRSSTSRIMTPPMCKSPLTLSVRSTCKSVTKTVSVHVPSPTEMPPFIMPVILIF